MASLLDYPAMLFRELFVPRKAQSFTVAEIGWTLTLPKNFCILSAKQIARFTKRGMKGLDDVIQKKNISPGRKILLVAKYEIHNSIIITFANFDDTTEDDWKTQNDYLYNSALKICHFRYKDFKHVDITTESGARQKGNIVFNALDIIAGTPSRELYHRRHYSTLYKNYGIHIIMSFIEEKIGEEMLDIIRNSTFGI